MLWEKCCKRFFLNANLPDALWVATVRASFPKHRRSHRRSLAHDQKTHQHLQHRHQGIHTSQHFSLIPTSWAAPDIGKTLEVKDIDYETTIKDQNNIIFSSKFNHSGLPSAVTPKFVWSLESLARRLQSYPVRRSCSSTNWPCAPKKKKESQKMSELFVPTLESIEPLSSI